MNGLNSRSTKAMRGRANRPCTRSSPCRPTSTITARASTVDQAAPCTPRPKPNISSGSNTIVAAAEPSVTYIARGASPSARSSPDRHMPAPSSGHDGNTISSSECVTSAVWPVAPSRRISGLSIGNASKANSVMTTTISASAAPANSLAWWRLPRPSARDVSALAAIDRPIETEVAKNSRVLA